MKLKCSYFGHNKVCLFLLVISAVFYTLEIPLLAQYEEALYEQNQQLLFQQNQYQTFQHDADYLARAKDISQIDTGITTATSNLKKGGPSFLIDTIQFEGELPVSRHKLMPILSRYEGQKLSLMEIEQLIEAITNTFIEEGYLTSRVFIKQQNFISFPRIKIH